jgi:proline iminopeptidase
VLEKMPGIKVAAHAALVALGSELTLLPVTKESVTWLYPAIEPYNIGRLRVSPIHEIYFEESGNRSGKPVVFLHGGPGGGSEPKQRRFFHPEQYRIINFDQRACGKSTPYGSLHDNTTWALVADIEKLREHLGIARWQLFGGSWGSTLALAYSESHPERVTELILRGIFILRRQEIDWFYQRGASALYPDAWEAYLAHIPQNERDHMLSAYYSRLTSDDAAVRLAAAKVWSKWEGATSKLLPDADFASHYEEDQFALAFARIEAHYFVNKGFLESDDQLLRDVSRIRHIPAVVVQGRYDVVCPMESAWALHRAWPEAEFIVVPDSGHSAFDPPNTRALVAAADQFSER